MFPTRVFIVKSFEVILGVYENKENAEKAAEKFDFGTVQVVEYPLRYDDSIA